MSDSVLRIAQLVTSLAAGGAQATVLDSVDVSRSVNSADPDMPSIQVTILAGLDGRDGGSTLWNDPRLPPEATVEVPRLVRRLSPLDDLMALWWLVRWLRRERPDVIHTHSSKAGVLGRVAAFLCRVPCAHTVHGWGPLYAERKLIAAMAVGLERLLAPLCSAIVVVGAADLDRGLDRGIGKPGQYRIIRSGVDTSIGARAADERHSVRTDLCGLCDRCGRCELCALAAQDRPPGASQIRNDDFIVGMVARMAHPKDHLTLIEAFRRADIAGSHLLLIGDGPTRPIIEQAIAEAGLSSRVHLLGQRSDAARLVAGFDVSVLSSRWEGMPRSVVEAAAASVPVVACDVGNVRDLIGEGRSGRLVEPGNVEAMAAALRASYHQRERHQQMAAVAAVEAERFSAQQMRDDLAGLWLALAHAQSSAGLHSGDHHAVATGVERSRHLAQSSSRPTTRAGTRPRRGRRPSARW